MEWTWLKDWWRLKKYRSQHRHRKLKHSHLDDPMASSHGGNDGRIPPADGEDYDGDDNVEGQIGNEFQRNAKCKMQDDEYRRRQMRRRRRQRKRLNSKVEANKTNDNNNDDDNEKRNGISDEGGGGGNDNDEAAAVAATADADEDDNEGDGDYDDDDYDVEFNEDDDVDDFCYCDECLNGDTDFCESNDGMDSDASTSSNTGKQVVVGICAMAKKTQSKPMKEILTRLQEFEFIKMVIFEEDVILKEPVENWPICDCLVSFHSKGFPLEKAIQYAQLRKPYVLNNLHMQYDIQDRRRVYAILEKEGIEIPRYAVLDRDSPDPKQHELIESEDHVEVNGIIFNKPFVEKPVSAEDHNIYIYYPTSAGGGSQRLFRKIGSRSSVYSPESRVRKTGSFIYEDFMPTDVYFPGTDVKVYTVGPDYAHAEARKSPALDGKVERDSEGKEIRYPVILNHAEKLISRKVCLAFKQTVCGFDLLRANGKSFVCDVNGFSFVKNSNKYYDDCAKILGNMILRELTPTLHIPWSVPFQLDDPPIVPTTFGKMMELRCVVAVIRHGDRTPKQKMKVEVRHPKFFEIFEKYDGFKNGHVKLKRPKQLQEILDIARFLLAEIETKDNAEIEEKKSKLEQLKSVLEMYGHFSGINRKVQMKYQPKGRPRGSSSDDDAPSDPSLVLILKWGGELTPAGRIQAEELGRIFRCMYPGGQGRQDYSGTQGLGLLRLHSTFRHDLKIYASDEGRVQMTAAAFAKGLLALEGELTPILVQMVKSANTNGLLDNDCDSSKYQNMAKNRLHELMQVDREFTVEDRAAINPNNSISINQALDFVKNPVECCNHVHSLIKELLIIISVKKDDPKTKDAILYHGETWDLMRCRWEKIEKDFSTKSKLFDISKIPDIYDCIKYDLQHNQHTLQYDQAEELYIYAKYLADIVIPQEYGLTMQEKLTIGQGICTPLLKKIKSDLQRNIEETEDESVNRLNPQYSHGVASPGRHVRTRLYFTSESHVHSLLTVLRYGGLLNVLTDEQWRRAMDYISMVSELNYMSQIVIMLYEDPTKDPTSEERFHVELHFSPGVNCCVQKNLPPGPGFRPHSRNDSGTLKTATHDECTSNPSRIDEENDTDESPVKTHLISPDGFDCEIRHSKSKPIPIGSHHTVAGHEAMDLAKRLNKELASQQQQHQAKQTGSLEANRPISPDGEPRSRSFEQRSQKSKDDLVASPPLTPSQPPAQIPTPNIIVSHNDREFREILTSRPTNPSQSYFQIRVTDSLTFFKIDSSTNELPLSEIDFSLTPGTPDGHHMCTAHKAQSPGSNLQKKQAQLLTMRRMESGDEGEFIHILKDIRRISPLATNERPLTCNCSGHFPTNNEEMVQPHSHSKSETDLSDMSSMMAPLTSKVSSPPMNIGATAGNISPYRAISFDENDEDELEGEEEDLQISSSAPASLLSGEFLMSSRPSTTSHNMSGFGLRPPSPTNSPTASTLRLCQAMEEQQKPVTQRTENKHALSKPVDIRKKVTLPSSQSAPVIADFTSSPFRFPALSFNQFDPIAENAATNANSSTNDTVNPIQQHNAEADMNTTIPFSPDNTNRDYFPLYHHHLHHHYHPHHYHHHNHHHHSHHHHHHHDLTHIHSHRYHSPHLHRSSSPSPYSSSPKFPSVVVITSTNSSSEDNLDDLLYNDDDDDNDTSPNNTSTTTTTTTTINANTNDDDEFISYIPHAITNSSNMSLTSATTNATNTDTTTPNTKTYHTYTTATNVPPTKSHSSIVIHNNNTNRSNNKPPVMSSTIINNPITDTTTDNTVTSTSSSSSVSSRRQRHSIAGQMSYMKMLGFGGFSKKMTTSTNSLFSTAVISGSSSAPNLRDMIPVSSSVFPLTVLDGFGGVPPIRPLETLHNALSLKQLDHFLERMTSAPLFKTPTCTPPKNPSTPLSMMTTITDEEACAAAAATVSTPTNNICRCNDNSILNERNPERCALCGRRIHPAAPDAESTPVAAAAAAPNDQQLQRQQTNNNSLSNTAAGASLWSKQSSIASSITEPSSPAISDTYSQETPSCEMSISLTSNEGGTYSLPPSSATAAKLARFFPRLDGDLNTVSVYTPMNLDSLDSTDTEFNMGAIGGGGGGGKSACLTPVSFNMDLSIVANKGSLTLSVDGFEEDEDATPSAATTPSLPLDEPHMELCYCCEGHAASDQPPDDDDQQSHELFNSMRNKRLDDNEPKHPCLCHIEEPPSSAEFSNADKPVFSIRKASDTISPKIQKQISLFESGDIERQKDYAALHASINIPQPNSLQLRQDARLRKFENLTQSTSNSNFPFESNTLKRVPNNVEDFVDVNLTQSCINFKSSGVAASDPPSTNSSPQHKPSGVAAYRAVTLPSECSGTASGPASPRPGALIVKEKFIEPPKRITRSFHGKTQSMDADFLFNEFLLVPAQAPAAQNSSSSEAGSASTSPSNRPNKRFTTTKVMDESLEDVDKV
ncbi:inositol hexakisphosphate and diphosphoinositol-pentakisphosphate kinase isoform X4 [Stomoxys calcitrans]|uniref:inositol hexakisphosphate and diphosphoinositol-pentakisphosphate kinase isoform X4 n=1 Tax=Stomoxys calcitrans TaxID=35570 RepID=UPI0027E24FA1|nr:inositol hexakisphosphate and diphosphoinositol-pentakisphosphate kinase isoform X4 [Stomoxys calcitrans]